MDIEREAFHYFNDNYYETNYVPFNKQMDLCNIFPLMASEEDNTIMELPVSKDKVQKILKYLARGKSPGLDC